MYFNRVENVDFCMNRFSTVKNSCIVSCRQFCYLICSVNMIYGNPRMELIRSFPKLMTLFASQMNEFLKLSALKIV